MQAGYPYSCHEVVTSDGYILHMHRLPRPGSRDASFFVHGVMDTALAWVGTSVTEALAFAAWDAGYDVWLASCRSNPPRTHTQRSCRGLKYFSYTVNELACLDLSAQVRCDAGLPVVVSLQSGPARRLAHFLVPRWSAPAQTPPCGLAASASGREAP